MKRSGFKRLTLTEAKERLRAKRAGKKPHKYGFGARKPLKPGRKTKAWEAERRKLKADSVRNNRTTCELRDVPHECTYDDMLGYAHSKKRRHIQGKELSEAVLACNNGHEVLERLPEAEMMRIVREVIAARQEAA